MKKTLLLLVTAVLGLVISCQEYPKSFDTYPQAAGAPGVDADTIKAEAFSGINLVSWGAAEDAVSYIIYRREVRDGDPVNSTIKNLDGVLNSSDAATYTSVKQIPYYRDDSIENGVVYQYGIAAQSYKSVMLTPAVSDVVWQDGSVAAIKSPLGTIIQPPATWPSITITPYNSAVPVSGSTSTDYYDRAKIVITGLLPDYLYSVYRQVATVPSPAANDWNGISLGTQILTLPYSTTINTWDNYLEKGATWEDDVPLYTDAPAVTYTDYQARIVVQATARAATETIIARTANTTSATPDDRYNFHNYHVISTGIRPTIAQ
jgi:hypothetical protein